jgi:hypothetical protein
MPTVSLSLTGSVVLNDKGEVGIQQKTCPRHPTPIDSEQLKEAQIAYLEVVKLVYSGVVRHVLKGGDDERYANAIKTIDVFQGRRRAEEPEGG